MVMLLMARQNLLLDSRRYYVQVRQVICYSITRAYTQILIDTLKWLTQSRRFTVQPRLLFDKSRVINLTTFHFSVFHNVKFIKPYISQTKVGSVIQIDVNTNKLIKRINWAHSKLFIFGSLVLLTKDKCKNFIVATILDRDPRQLSEGKVRK